MTGAVGMITGGEQSESILKEKKADLILYARESLRQPYLPFHAARDLNDDTKWPIQYLRAKNEWDL
jgi:2,4-dienoyl-CoA reductase-like NADH-dependent reductase (Old Yellow Enzyme family)